MILLGFLLESNFYLEKFMDANTQTELEAAAFRRLIAHLQEHTEVQNIELMNLANFCRNCLAKWYLSAAENKAVTLDYDAAREYVYGMPYNDWKEQFQKAATEEQLAAYANRKDV